MVLDHIKIVYDRPVKQTGPTKGSVTCSAELNAVKTLKMRDVANKAHLKFCIGLWNFLPQTLHIICQFTSCKILQ